MIHHQPNINSHKYLVQMIHYKHLMMILSHVSNMILRVNTYVWETMQVGSLSSKYRQTKIPPRRISIKIAIITMEKYH
jgi:hypothetical protein